MSDELQRPTSDDDRNGWKTYWAVQGMPWRMEPEIDEARRRYLAERRVVKPEIEKGLYPFRDGRGSIRLTRGDVEWLLAMHESGGMRGPVRWDDPQQRDREGLDLRGATLAGVNLERLPLVRLRAGLSGSEWTAATNEQRRWAGVALKASTLRYAHLEDAILTYGGLEGADLRECHLEGAELTNASLAADAPAKLRLTFFDLATRLDGVTLANRDGVGPRLVDAHWGGVNLAVVDWASVRLLGEEARAHLQMHKGVRKSTLSQIWDYESAVRANRQLSTILRSQGLNEHADRFAYRAQVLQCRVLVLQRRLLRAFGSWMLELVAGYGYRPLRSFIAYAVVILGFACAYLLNAQFAAPHLTWDESLVLSISSFHGRGFFSSGVSLGDTLARLAAGEAIIGLLIEITFIATFTQRFFAR